MAILVFNKLKVNLSRDYSKEILSLHKSAKNDQIYINLATLYFRKRSDCPAYECMYTCSTLLLQLKVFPMHFTNYIQANELKSPLMSPNLHAAYSITCKNIHIFKYFLNRMQNTKRYCSRTSFLHSWYRLLNTSCPFKQRQKSQNKIARQQFITIYEGDIKMIFLNTTWPLGEIPNRNKYASETLVYECLIDQEVGKQYRWALRLQWFWARYFHPVYPWPVKNWKPLYADYMQIRIQACSGHFVANFWYWTISHFITAHNVIYHCTNLIYHCTNLIYHCTNWSSLHLRIIPESK
jgi:hypothetical protein